MELTKRFKRRWHPKLLVEDTIRALGLQFDAHNQPAGISIYLGYDENDASYSLELSLGEARDLATWLLSYAMEARLTTEEREAERGRGFMRPGSEAPKWAQDRQAVLDSINEWFADYGRSK